MGLLGGYAGLATCRGIIHGSMGESISVFVVFLEVQIATVLSFMEYTCYGGSSKDGAY